jgi:hypothetical protein
LRAVQDSENLNFGFVNTIGNDVGSSGDHKLPRSFHATFVACERMTHEQAHEGKDEPVILSEAKNLRSSFSAARLPGFFASLRMTRA